VKHSTLTILLTAALLLLPGCRGGAAVPKGWTVLNTDRVDAHDWPVGSESLRDDQPRLQVLIHYSPRISTHTAVRVTTPDARPVFWDPGGNYGTTKPKYGRQNDVILQQPPDTQTWWAYRYHWLGEPFLYVFEWDLPADQAAVMRDALLSGASHDHDPVFRTRRNPGFCNYAVADFLRTFATPPLSPKLRGTFLPDGLAKQLWQHHPDRVLRYEGLPDVAPLVLLPPTASAAPHLPVEVAAPPPIAPAAPSPIDSAASSEAPASVDASCRSLAR